MTLDKASLREEITSSFTIDEHGLIVNPGKFEREMVYVPFYYDSWGNGAASEDFGRIAFFEILTDERAAFPELGDAFGLMLEETETGFVVAKTYDAREAYETDIKRAEAEQSEEGEF